MSLYLEHISHNFGNTPVLKDVNLEIRDGEFVAVLGPSGCGKTTLLRIIGGFLEPSQGVVRLNDRLLSGNGVMVPVEERNLGMVFQSFALWPHMTVRQHVGFPLKSRRMRALSDAEKKRAVETTLESMGLAALSEHYPGELSGGQRQRVSLARAVVGRTSCLLMDEPLSSLDAELKISMRKEIQDIHRSTGATVIYVTHDQSEALAMADRILVMHGGTVEQIGTPREIYTHPQTEFVATFVSKCNLIHGQWQKGSFHVAGQPLFYDDIGIASAFKSRGLYPVRPEQFAISRTQRGLEAVITNRQFCGRETHYSLRHGDNNLQVVTDCSETFQPGETVQLVFSA